MLNLRRRILSLIASRDDRFAPYVPLVDRIQAILIEYHVPPPTLQEIMATVRHKSFHDLLLLDRKLLKIYITSSSNRSSEAKVCYYINWNCWN
jgi:hypothetical protein